MARNSGRLYWARKKFEKIEGIVVVFAWISSEDKEIEPFVDLYASLGWNSLVCHPEYPNSYVTKEIAMLALGVLDELLKEVKTRPLPIVFAAFSNGSKACMYKVLQIIGVKCETLDYLDEYQLVRDCISGQIYDSSPSGWGSQLVNHPYSIKTPQPPRVLSWITKAIASGLDALFPNRFEAQSAEYWQTLCSLVLNGPYLLFCSEVDNLAPYNVICNFAQHLQDLGGDVKVVTWTGSPHLGHYRHHPVEYKAAVAELFEKATLIYSQRLHQSGLESLNKGGAGDKIADSVCNLYQAAMSSNQSFRRVAVDPSDHFFLPSSEEYRENTVHDNQKEQSIQLQDQPRISAHSVLGQVLFDVCVPKNIEDWDIKPVGPLSRNVFGSSKKHTSNPLKCIRRSRL